MFSSITQPKFPNAALGIGKTGISAVALQGNGRRQFSIKQAATVDLSPGVVEPSFLDTNILAPHEFASCLREVAEIAGLLNQKRWSVALPSNTARTAILAGAEFLVSPTVNLDVIKLALRYDKGIMPGAYTPTEVLTAWEAGADIVKLFPADIGGPAYLKALKGPLPQIRLMPTGGVNLQTLKDFVKAGACAVGLGSQLVEKDAVERGDFDRIRSLAAQYVELMKQARA